MEEVKQSLQETASKELDSYKSVFLKKTVVCMGMIMRNGYSMLQWNCVLLG